MRDLSLRKSALQVLSFLSLLFLVMSLARFFHHQTDSIFVDYWDYLSSFRIAFPPLLILSFSYFVAFIGGKRVADIPSSVISFFRNRYLQSDSTMIAGIIVTFLACGAILSRTEFTAPPEYEKLVNAILAGEIDRSAEAKDLLQKVEERNPAFADHLNLVVQTFELRRQINLEAHVSDIVQSRLLIRALSNPSNVSWGNHPMRIHALAEAHSLMAQGVLQKGSSNLVAGLGKLSPNELFDDAISLYEQVRTSNNHRLATPQLRASAANNIGNVHLYKGDHQEALDAYLEVVRSYPDYKSPGTLGNVIAALILLRRYDDAAVFGEEAKVWAEENGKAFQDTAHYVSILTNTGFAHLAAGNYSDATPLFEVSALIENDAVTKLNVALNYAMGGFKDQAESALRKISAPIGYKRPEFEKSMVPDIRCSYLVWALYDPFADSRDIAARLFVFLGERRAPDELEVYADHLRLAALRQRAALWLPHFPGSCAYFSAIPAVLRFVQGASPLQD
ncbi:tetratricopeptide repeat protein [uncultured Hoeflea sp.]|uniref:tetratricopeptide repeat protein n=1 Tax=uncultured Hoeflea sp. TaxID=538666 RepID=UPI0030EB9F88